MHATAITLAIAWVVAGCSKKQLPSEDTARDELHARVAKLDELERLAVAEIVRTPFEMTPSKSDRAAGTRDSFQLTETLYTLELAWVADASALGARITIEGNGGVGGGSDGLMGIAEVMPATPNRMPESTRRSMREGKFELGRGLYFTEWEDNAGKPHGDLTSSHPGIEIEWAAKAGVRTAKFAVVFLLDDTPRPR